MTEKDKEIQELRRENESLRNTNVILLGKLTKMINEYNKMLAAISKHSNTIKSIIEGLK